MTGSNTPLNKEKMLTERLDIDFALKIVQLGIWELDPVTRLFDYDDRCRELFGLARANQLPYEQVISHIHPDDVDQVDRAIRRLTNAQAEDDYEATFRTVEASDGVLRWIRFAARSYVNEAGELYRLAGIVQDITESVLNRQKTEQSDSRFQQIIDQTPVAMLVAKGPDLVVKTINQAMQSLLNQESEILEKPVLRAIPELSAQPIINRLQQVYQTGESYNGWAVEIPLYRKGKLEMSYFNLNSTPYYEDNEIIGVVQVATEVTDQVKSAKKIEASENRFRNLIEEYSVATCLLVGQDMKIDVANDVMLSYWGKDKSVIGKTHEEAIPELKGQPFEKILKEVFTTGKTYEAKAARAELIVNDLLSTYYFDFTYKPLRNSAGEVDAILAMAVDVTEQVSSRQKLEESNDQLEFAIDATELGTWDLNPATNKFTANLRLKEWFGVLPEDEVELSLATSVIADKDRQRVTNAIQQALQHSSGGHYDINYTIIHPVTKQERIVRAKGKTWFTDEKIAYRFNGTLQDITEQKKAEEEKQKLISIMEASHEFIGLAAPDTSIQYGNPAALNMLGWDTFEGKNIQDSIYPEDWKLAEKLLSELLNKGHFSQEIRFMNARTGDPFWLQWNAVALKEPVSDEVIGLAIVSPNITERKKAEQALTNSEARFRNLIIKAPFATAVYVTRELIIDIANEAMINVWGKTPAVVGMALADALPELEGQPFIGLLEQVYDTGIPYQTNEQQVNLVTDGHLQAYWFTFTYQPLTTDQGQVYAILNMAVDVTERVVSRQRIEESQQQLLASFEQSPVAIAIIDAADLTFRMANPFYGQLVGRTPNELVGKPLLEALPELRGQGFDRRLKDVIDTGIPFIAAEATLEVIRNNQPETIYVHLTFQPQGEADPDTGIERIARVLVVATDITQQVLARKKIEETEIALRGAIELAELATWSLDIELGLISYSERFMEWLGFSEDTKDLDESFNPLPDEYRQSVIDAIASVIQPGSSGLYENEHPIINRLTGQERIIHAQAQVFYDAAGKSTVLRGTAQDITSQRQLQSALEQQVQERTEELESTNEELAAINEEYAATNEELTESNQLLIRSNDNLQQFAYVASHDLQEPLRKVQQFGDLLKTQYANQLGEGVAYLERMQAAASRMSTLIRDLLSFSRISTQQDTITSVSLNTIVNTVLNDLELRLQETGAIVEVEFLPKLQGDRSQLEQLFQNLVSNALKFSRLDQSGIPIPPLIRISCQSLTALELPASVKPTRSARNYYRIDISDNGIGFEQKYVDRIFQVFQRLHSKSEFAGTGIGLAICEKVIANHGGAITASSQPGQGATFQLYLPATDK